MEVVRDTDALCPSHGGVGEIDFCDRSVIKDDSSSNAQVADRGTSFRMRIESTVLHIMNSLIFYDPISYRKIGK